VPLAGSAGGWSGTAPSRYANLAVGVTHENDATASNDGGVSVIFGSLGALSATVVPDRRWGQDTPSVQGSAEADDWFGSALAVAG